MFVTFDTRLQAGLTVTMETSKIDTSLSLVEGWPIVKLTSPGGAHVQHFSFRDVEQPMQTPKADGSPPWKVTRSNQARRANGTRRTIGHEGALNSGDNHRAGLP